MKITYDRDADILTIRLRSGDVDETDESTDGMICDYNERGELVAIEILRASKSVDNPEEVKFETTSGEDD